MIKITDSNHISEVTLYGKCEQNGTPTPENPVDIVCNNGTLKVDSNGNIYTQGTVETLTDNLGNQITAEMLLSIGAFEDTQKVIEGSIERKVGIKVLTGKEDWWVYNRTHELHPECYGYYVTVTDLIVNVSIPAKCSHFNYVRYTWETGGLGNFANHNLIRNVYFVTDKDSVEAWKQWLADQYAAGTPVIVVYPLATSVTESVTSQSVPGKTVSQTAGSISNLKIEENHLFDLKKRYISDANGNTSEVKKAYIGTHLTHLHLKDNTPFTKRITCNGNIGEAVDVTGEINNIKGRTVVWNQVMSPDDWVDMGLPSGTLWCKKNIDITQADRLTASEFQYDCSFFSWGNVDGHNPISASSFDYDWGSVNSAVPWYDGQPYGNTPGNSLTDSIHLNSGYDAAQEVLGSIFRMPTSTEFEELFANIIYIDANGNEVDTTAHDKRVTVNGVIGLYIQSKINGARLFFSCSGNGNGRSWSSRGSIGRYWSSTWSSVRSAWCLTFYSGEVYPQSNGYRYNGFALRPVCNPTDKVGKGGTKFLINNKNMFDLTRMFGEGNEPSTVEEFEAMFPEDYYPYSEPKLLSFTGKELKSTWDNEEHTASFDLSTIVDSQGNQVFPDGLRSAGNVYDEIKVENGVTKAIKRIGSVDLGILSPWYADSSMTNLFYTTFDDSANFTKNALSIKYIMSNAQGLTVFKSDNVDKSMYINNIGSSAHRNLYIIDKSYTGVTAFKASLSGVILYYELVTPEEYILDSISLPKKYLANGLGTEEIISDSTNSPATAPADMEIEYRLT